jgi:hypothetical protein
MLGKGLAETLWRDIFHFNYGCRCRRRPCCRSGWNKWPSIRSRRQGWNDENAPKLRRHVFHAKKKKKKSFCSKDSKSSSSTTTKAATLSQSALVRTTRLFLVRPRGRRRRESAKVSSSSSSCSSSSSSFSSDGHRGSRRGNGKGGAGKCKWTSPEAWPAVRLSAPIPVSAARPPPPPPPPLGANDTVFLALNAFEAREKKGEPAKATSALHDVVVTSTLCKAADDEDVVICWAEAKKSLLHCEDFLFFCRYLTKSIILLFYEIYHIAATPDSNSLSRLVISVPK